MKSLPTVHQVKMRHSEINFVSEQKHFTTKYLSLFAVILFISDLVAMTTVVVSFLHATVNVYQISKHYLFK